MQDKGGVHELLRSTKASRKALQGQGAQRGQVDGLIVQV